MAKAGGGSRSRHWPSTLQNVEEGQSRGGGENSVKNVERSFLRICRLFIISVLAFLVEEVGVDGVGEGCGVCVGMR